MIVSHAFKSQQAFLRPVLLLSEKFAGMRGALVALGSLLLLAFCGSNEVVISRERGNELESTVVRYSHL